MAEPRPPEQVRDVIAVAAGEIEPIATLDEERAWETRHDLALGQKGLARLAILDWPRERVGWSEAKESDVRGLF